MNRFSSFLDWNNDKNMFFHVVMFLRSFPRQHSALSSKNQMSDLSVSDTAYLFKANHLKVVNALKGKVKYDFHGTVATRNKDQTA